MSTKIFAVIGFLAWVITLGIVVIMLCGTANAEINFNMQYNRGNCDHIGLARED